MSRPLTLRELEAPFTVHRLAPDAKLPQAVLSEPFVFLARTDEELSITAPAAIEIASERREGRWRALVVQGPLDFSLVGILATLTATLAEAEVSVFAISTFDTDYLLVREEAFESATGALRSAGHTVHATREDDKSGHDPGAGPSPSEVRETT